MRLKDVPKAGPQATEYIGCRIDSDTKAWLVRYVKQHGLRSVSALIATMVKQLRERESKP